MEIRKFKKVLVANRGEIALRVFRALNELGITSVAIYSKEDKYGLFRSRADEAYQLDPTKGPVDAYLDIPTIINIAKERKVDAIHPGYGFLSENANFAKACEEAGITFIGPTHEMMERLGDKISSKLVADEVGVPCIPGVEAAITSDEEAVEFAKAAGYPVMLKAAAGGGGRGMRIVHNEADLLPQFRSARNEAVKAFGNGDIFTGGDAKRMLDFTGCDGVAIARGAMGSPWIFREAKAALEGREIPEPPSYIERLEMARRQFELAASDRGERTACLEARKHLAWYIKGMPYAAYFRDRIMSVSTLHDIYGVTRDIEDALRERERRPDRDPR